jgi:hypothetical protein
MTQEERRVAARAFWIYAVWKNGRQFVGAMNKPLEEAQADMLAGKMDAIYAQAPEPRA